MTFSKLFSAGAEQVSDSETRCRVLLPYIDDVSWTAMLLNSDFAYNCSMCFEQAGKHRMRNLLMSRNATSKKQRANILWMKRVIQTCFVLAFGIWVVNQFKLFIGNGNVKTDMSSEFFVVMRKSMPNEQLKLTRKTLKISTEHVETKHVEDGVKERSDAGSRKQETGRSEELTENWIDDFDNQVFEKAESMNDTSSRVHGAENTEDRWSDNFESLDTSVSEFDQDEKEDNSDVEVSEETTRIEEASQEDAADQ